MKVQSVQANQTFQARFLEKSQLENMQTVLRKMNSETSYRKTSEYTFETKMLNGLRIKDEAYFHDGRFLVGKTDKVEGTSSLEFGKTELEFNNKTGEIMNSKKPFFTKWSAIMDKVSEYFDIAVKSFDNPDLVNKRFVGLRGFTEKGSQRIEEAQKAAEREQMIREAQRKAAEKEAEMKFAEAKTEFAEKAASEPKTGSESVFLETLNVL